MTVLDFIKDTVAENAESPSTRQPIRVGFPRGHGMTDELVEFPPPGVTYSYVRDRPVRWKLVRSPIPAYLQHVDSPDHDLLETILVPIVTKNNWILSIECLQAALAFSFLGCPLPVSIRVAYLKYLMLQRNAKHIVFWSEAGRRTLSDYGRVRDRRLLAKSSVVYPAIRAVPDRTADFHDDEVQILFCSEFFRKGGVHVVEAFERAQKRFPKIRLRVCCDERIDFKTPNSDLKREFLARIRANPAITFGRVPRDVMINKVLPQTDIYLLPTYVEAFGFALLEAMAFGIPVISTNYFAIPEIVEHNRSGFLVDTSQFDCDRMFRGYVVDRIPTGFREYMSEKVYEYLCALIESVELRKKMGQEGARIAQSKFSLESRNARMLEIYRQALA